MRPLINEIKVGKKKREYWDSPTCSICNAVDEDKKPMRLKIDKFAVTHTEKETRQFIEDLGIQMEHLDFSRHFKSHSLYINEAKETIKKASEKMALSRIDKIEEAYIEADEVIQDIITQGGLMIRAGEMRVDSKLLLGALKEQGARKKFGTLHDMFKELDRKRFVEGEIVAEEKLPELGPTNAN